MEIRKEMEVTHEVLLYLFLLNMSQLTPTDRSRIARILDVLVGIPIENDYRKK
jgi:hypothetical protein